MAPLDDGWQVVRRKLSKKAKMELRSMIVWGLPPSTDPRLFHEQLGVSDVVECYWRAMGAQRHMVVAFPSVVSKSALERAVRDKCGQWFGIKVAKYTRTWKVRRRHRMAPSPALDQEARAPPPVNEYELLEKAGAIPKPAGRRRYERKLLMRRIAYGGGGRRWRGRATRAKLAKQLRKDTIRVGSLNADGGLQDSCGEYEEYARKCSFDVLAIQETRLKQKANLAVQGYKVFRPDSKFHDEEHGVIMLVANHLAVGAVKEKCSFANQLWVRIAGVKGKRDMVVCSAYMPQERRSAEARKSAFEALQATVKEYEQDCDVVILGDLNAKLGSAKNDREAQLLGRHGEPGQRTQNGKLLLKMMVSSGMTSLAGQAAPPESLTQTAECGFWWTRFDKVTKKPHAIDYVLVSACLQGSDAKFWVDYTDLNSDHHLIGADVPSPRAVARARRRKKKKRRFKMEVMIQKSSKEEDIQVAEAMRELYSGALREAFKGFTKELLDTKRCSGCASTQCTCEGVAECMRRFKAAAEKSVGSTVVGKRFSRRWYDSEVRDAVKARRAAYADYLLDTSRAKWAEYAAQRRGCRKLIKKSGTKTGSSS